MAVTRDQRALVQLVSLKTHGSKNLSLLYSFLESSGELLVGSVLAPHYAKFVALTGGRGSLGNLKAEMQKLHDDAKIKAIDLVFMVHGLKERVFFEDGDRTMRSVAGELAAATGGRRDKYRMLYSTTCFGKSHADNFVDAGFKAASGSGGVNTNSGTELAPFLGMWSAGIHFRMAVSLAYDRLSSVASDVAAAGLGMPMGDSRKTIVGDGNFNINM